MYQNCDQINQKLQQIKQSQLLKFWDGLNDTKKQNLLEQIEKLEFENIPKWAHIAQNSSHIDIPKDFGPAPAYDPADSDHSTKYQKATQLGQELISKGKTAGFTVAGGQGTRLGFDGPKGNFPVSPIKNKTLFQIFGENLAATAKKYSTTIPWYIMTSPLNDAETKEILRSNDYFGLGADNVIIFQQGTMPNFSFDGKILLAEKDSIAASPDGHGGSLKALYKSGAVSDMQKRGIEYISYWQVDNPIVNLVDPLFIGLHAIDNAEMSSKALPKADPMEKVGNFCLAGGKVTVIEYSDLPDEQALRRESDGSLTFDLGSIGIHIISRNFVEKLNAKGFALPLHKAVKKIPHIDLETGTKIEPTEPNGVKLETFVFDALPMAKNSMILKTERNEEFAPVKNAEGTDSPAVTRAMMTERAAKWLEFTGIKVPRKPDGSPDCVLEISPYFALTKEDLKQKADQIPTINPGDQLYLE